MIPNDSIENLNSTPIIHVSDLGKFYKIYHNPKDKLKEISLLGKKHFHKKFWALKNISFDVFQGDCIGIIGKNGSGKSTLLQIICNTLHPNSGTVEINGRVAALLELGAGFNPEFTGKENVYLNASILGLSNKEIDDKFLQIVKFADIGEFIDQPVKIYSSGMYVRLAFSVAINVEPDILVIDEALSVGDEIFKRKCFSRIENFKDSGVTILFVSHSLQTIIDICDKAICLDKGEIIAIGEPNKVVAKYLKLNSAPYEVRKSLRNSMKMDSLQDSQTIQFKETNPIKYNSSDRKILSATFDPDLLIQNTTEYIAFGAKISDIKLQKIDGKVVNVLLQRETYVFRYDIHVLENCYNMKAAMLIKTVTGTELGGAYSSNDKNGIPFVKKNSVLQVTFKFKCLLRPGTYFLNCGVQARVNEVEKYLDRRIDCLAFRVISGNQIFGTSKIDFLIEPVVSML